MKRFLAFLKILVEKAKLFTLINYCLWKSLKFVWIPAQNHTKKYNLRTRKKQFKDENKGNNVRFKNLTNPINRNQRKINDVLYFLTVYCQKKQRKCFKHKKEIFFQKFFSLNFFGFFNNLSILLLFFYFKIEVFVHLYKTKIKKDKKFLDPTIVNSIKCENVWFLFEI